MSELVGIAIGPGRSLVGAMRAAGTMADVLGTEVSATLSAAGLSASAPSTLHSISGWAAGAADDLTWRIDTLQHSQTAWANGALTMDDFQFPSLQAAQSFAAGQAQGRKVQDALAAGDQWIGGKIWDHMFGPDHSKDLGNALDVVQQHGNDPWYQAGFLTQMGPKGAVSLEDKLHDNSAYNHVVRDALAVAASVGAISTGYQQEVVQEASFEQLARLTDDPVAHRMSDDFLLAAGRKAATEGIEGGWVGAETGFPVYVEDVKSGVDALLSHIAASSHVVSMQLLEDQTYTWSFLHMSALTPDANGVPDLLRAGTATDLRPQHDGEVDQALASISQVLADPKSFMVDAPGFDHDHVVSQKVADALADVYVNNVDSFARATQQDAGPFTFGRDDVRSFLVAPLQWSSTHDRMTAASQVEVAKLLANGNAFGDRRYADGMDAAAKEVGDFTGAFADGFAAAALKNAANQDAHDKVVASLLTGGIGMLPAFAPGGPWVGAPASFIAGQVGQLVASEAAGGGHVDLANEALNTQEGANFEALQRAVLYAYYADAQRAVAPGADVPAAEHQRAQDMLDAVRHFDATLPANERILGADGNLIDPASLHPDSVPADAARLRHINDLLNGHDGTRAETVSHDVDPVIARIEAEAGVSRNHH